MSSRIAFPHGAIARQPGADDAERRQHEHERHDGRDGHEECGHQDEREIDRDEERDVLEVRGERVTQRARQGDRPPLGVGGRLVLKSAGPVQRPVDPVVAIPSRKYRWPRKKITSIGTVTITPPTASSSKWRSPPIEGLSTTALSPRGSV